METQTTAQKTTPNRARNIVTTLRMSPDEKYFITEKMKRAGYDNFNQFVLHSLIRSEIKVVDLAPYRELAKEVNHIGTNINQIVKSVNARGRIYNEEIEYLKRRMDELWQLLKSSLSEQR